MKKKGGNLRLCVGYRAINKLTILNRYPLPCIGDLQEKVKGADGLPALTWKICYKLIRIKPSDEWKTAIKDKAFIVCVYGHVSRVNKCVFELSRTMDEILQIIRSANSC